MADDRRAQRGPGGSPRGRRATGSSVLTPPTGVTAVPPAPSRRPDLGAPPRTAPAPAAVPIVPVVGTAGTPCRCGHSPDAHRHFRRGSDCGQCGAGACTAYRPVDGVVRRLLRSTGLID